MHDDDEVKEEYRGGGALAVLQVRPDQGKILLVV
jgi:hypothetical protein